MSVDFYVAVPAADWPTVAAIQQCAVAQNYPIEVKRLPIFEPSRTLADGVTLNVDQSQEVYLEGELFSQGSASEDVKVINDRIASSSGSFNISSSDAVLSVRTQSAAEARGAIYLIASLIVCFHGYGFEPQGNEHGRADFAKNLISGAEALKGL